MQTLEQTPTRMMSLSCLRLFDGYVSDQFETLHYITEANMRLNTHTIQKSFLLSDGIQRKSIITTECIYKAEDEK
jgi:hypothetical protein